MVALRLVQSTEFPSFWDAWNSVEDRYSIGDGNRILREGDVVGRIVDQDTVGL